MILEAEERLRTCRRGQVFVARFALLIAYVSMIFAGCSAGPEPRSPNVLLVTFDTLRADAVGAYRPSDSTRSATPGLDAFAARGVLFEHAIAASSLTVPAHVAIMTGRWPRETSVGTRNGDLELDGALETLAESFRAAGYETRAFVGNIVLRRELGLDRGFEAYDDELPEAELNRPLYFERIAGDTVARVRSWLRERKPDRPFFLWVHLQDPHGPYTPPADFESDSLAGDAHDSIQLPVLERNMGRGGIPAYQALPDEYDIATYRNRYLDEIRYADRVFSELLAATEHASGGRGLFTVATADHGESLGEDGFYFQHGQSTRPELARVPLIMGGTGIRNGRSQSYVSHIDIPSTLLQRVGLPALPRSLGVPLLLGDSTAEVSSERWLLCDTSGEVGAYRADQYVRAFGPGALDRSAAARALEFSALDPLLGKTSSAARIPGTARDQITTYLREQVGADAAVDLSPADRSRLEALGYGAE